MWIGKCFTTYCRFQTLNGLRTIAELETQRVKITILWMERVSIVSTMPTHTHTLLTHQYSIKHILTLHNFESMYIRLTHLWFGPPSPGHGAHISSVFGPSSSVKQTLHQIHTYHNHVQLPTGGGQWYKYLTEQSTYRHTVVFVISLSVCPKKHCTKDGPWIL